MSMKKTYYSVQGEILGEKAAGGQRVDYLTDALGSLTATVDQTGTVLNRYVYKPDGALQAGHGGR
jgi:YD repeat-containing protein